jgi:hypothetical protein
MTIDRRMRVTASSSDPVIVRRQRPHQLGRHRDIVL